ncbi:MAG: hypothetical protein PWQ55_598 [Chloroflexota bacterium]|nr:hypothetical protein [Chloroflexota bacterium]
MTLTKAFTRKPLVIRIALIAAIAYALFLSLFALDVFSAGAPLSDTLLALAIHLLPTLAILLFAWIGWKAPLIGGLLFVVVGVAYVIEAGGQTLVTYLLIAGPPVLIGLLFLWGYRQLHSS